MADNYILEMENVDKIYGSGDSEVKALNHVSFSVHKGEFIAIIGESGSGKSTLLNIVGMLDRPTNGKIVIDGIEQREMTLDQQAVFRRENIGFIFQSFNLIQELTVEIDEIEAAIKQIMDEEIQSPILTIPGISYRMGAMIIAEIGDFSRFDSADKILLCRNVTIYLSIRTIR